MSEDATHSTKQRHSMLHDTQCAKKKAKIDTLSAPFPTGVDGS